ncbi:MAG TPA: NTP transferase domain-containing protein, partial [Blastocatellia bacterium]|nr:NTP transferase domain-containing protein [Blastocatellia bacterium]
ILILACDMPFISAEFLSFLIQIHERENNDVTVPVDSEGRTQMLIGVYSPNCLEPIAQMLNGDQLKVERLCERVKARRVSFDEYAHLTNAQQLLTNLNTLNEYRAIQPE